MYDHIIGYEGPCQLYHKGMHIFGNLLSMQYLGKLGEFPFKIDFLVWLVKLNDKFS